MAQQDTTPRSIECKISDKLVRFRDILNQKETTQQDLHDIIMQLSNGDGLTPEDTALVQDVLNAFLSLTFIIKANQQEVERFIDYHA